MILEVVTCTCLAPLAGASPGFGASSASSASSGGRLPRACFWPRWNWNLGGSGMHDPTKVPAAVSQGGVIHIHMAGRRPARAARSSAKADGGGGMRMRGGRSREQGAGAGARSAGQCARLAVCLSAVSNVVFNVKVGKWPFFVAAKEPVRFKIRAEGPILIQVRYRLNENSAATCITNRCAAHRPTLWC